MSTTQTAEKLGLMQAHPYFQGLDDAILEDVAAHVDVRELDVAEVVYAADEPMTEIGFLVGGRLKGMYVDNRGEERLLRFAERGEAIGMIATAIGEPIPVEIIAVEPSRLLVLDYEVAFELTMRHPTLRRRWSTKTAHFIRANTLGDAPKRETSIVGLFHPSPATRDFTRIIVSRLRELGEDVAVLSDQPESAFAADVPFRCAQENGRWIDETELHQQLAKWGKPHRIILDLDAKCELDRTKKITSMCHNVLWVTRPEEADSVCRRLQEVEAPSPAFRDKTSVVWLLKDEVRRPLSPAMHEVTSREFKVPESAMSGSQNGCVPGVERVAQFMRGVQIGVALGGGAARGMAHLGVLRALEEQGIVDDRIAGTSAGAMTGILYGAGFTPDFLIDSFTRDLRPSWCFRNMPRGGYWYLMYKYRWGRFDPMLRKYMGDLRLEQLPIPCSSITINLVSGQAIVRREGDAVHAILESINLPILSTPIMRQGQALIDGGFVNNVPADVLASQGCNLIIAVDVTATIEKTFGAPSNTGGRMRTPNAVQTLLRTYAVQSSNMNSIGVQPADVRIEPDVSQFGMAEFTRAREMSLVGEQATLDKLPALQRLLDRLNARPRPIS